MNDKIRSIQWLSFSLYMPFFAPFSPQYSKEQYSLHMISTIKKIKISIENKNRKFKIFTEFFYNPNQKAAPGASSTNDLQCVLAIKTIREIMHKKNGWLARPKNIDDLVDGLRYMYDNPNIRMECGKMARHKAVHYDQKSFIDSHLQLYQQTLNKRKFPRFYQDRSA